MNETMEHSGTITYNTSNPISVKVARGQRGGYGWEIEVKGSDPQAIIAQVNNIDQQLRATYRTETPE